MPGISKHPLTSRRPWRLGVAACVLVLSAQASLAAPDGSRADPVLDWLSQKGLVPTQGEGSMVQAVRDRASDMVLRAMSFLGVPYKYGGSNADSGFDCSGFTRYVFEHSLGLVLPRRADEQASSNALTEVRVDELKPGDLVFFNTMKRAFSHVGIYIGDNKFIHAPRSGAVVRVEDMRLDYWTKRFNGARRAPGSEALDSIPAGSVVEAPVAGLPRLPD